MSKQAENKIKRDQRMQERFDWLYKTERKRIDDVYQQLEEEFCINKEQIQRRLVALNDLKE